METLVLMISATGMIGFVLVALHSSLNRWHRLFNRIHENPKHDPAGDREARWHIGLHARLW